MATYDAADDDGSGDGVRRRILQKLSTEVRQNEKVDNEEQLQHDQNAKVVLESGSFWLTRIVFLRAIGFIYFVAFLVALHQNKQLIGEDGLLPAKDFLDKIKKHSKEDMREMLTHIPSVIWFLDYENNLNYILDGLAYLGMVISGFVVLGGCANIIMMLLLWVVYHSLVNVGQRWYGFGWESQLLETGFLAAFFCPLLTVKKLPRRTPTPFVNIWGFRWLIFRIMIGAGLIKIRGDKCWRDLTCMNYHYETQPVPNPIAYYMHQEPEVMHKIETSVNHFVELVAPVLILIPFRPLCIAGGLIQILFQVLLIISGNLSFLNWLTILPSLCCLDDKFFGFFFSDRPGGIKQQVQEIQREEREGNMPRKSLGQIMRFLFNLSLAVLIAYLSIPVVQNLLSKRQAMNTSFDPLRLVNTYGAFGSVTKERTEVIIQGTYSNNPYDEDVNAWKEYEFKCKPGNVTRRPCLISPYHYRLDWLMWFAAFQNYQYNNWLVHLAAKLLVNDPGATSLLENNPFEGKKPPKFIRVEHYRYTYTKLGSNDAKRGRWWKRKHIGNYLPPISIPEIKDYLRQMGWPIPRLPK
ncbi:lipase maturation factor 1-like [Lineus longissimus]|uniref:lipase maturation factor 1-like n=1 Tax=Lineus longissimus TaxID=88925 RepID=UPI00315CCBEE